ncbi:MAG: aminomethyl-transferring glycine dehydrogenase subunit GcvPB [Syntrophaceae bacterium]|nr:aminomethyl-transferring glycine dehydrogenase subunit GcvPB [Syntrophaceae bacterium]
MNDKWLGASGLVLNEPLIFEKGAKGRKAYSLPKLDVEKANPEDIWPPKFIRDELEGFPEMSEVDVVRHFTRLSQWNYGVDSGFYPLGSCTMKYNPKVNEEMARLPDFAGVHPYQPEEFAQGAIQIIYELEQYLGEVSGMDRVTLQPSAGAQGELTGMLMIRAYLMDRGNPRKKVLVPDTAHGTNPASSSLCGYQVVQVKSDERGRLSPRAIEEKMDEDVAALMVTNPNTLGLFEDHICEVAQIVHQKGGLIYCDGANLNALMGLIRVGDMGVDVLHFNLHKTFSTPHGGGGPGAGPVGVKAHLADYLPLPVVVKEGDRFRFEYNRPKSIGKVRSFYGNFGILVRAYSYILSMGAEGLKKASLLALLNANYIRARLKGTYHLPYDFPCMHECVFNDKLQNQFGVTALDIAKRLMDYGFHPPTIYFPLVVHGALMIEPTESEAKETLDQFIESMIQIAKEAETDPELVRSAPHRTKVSRLDEVLANRKPKLRWKP